MKRREFLKGAVATGAAVVAVSASATPKPVVRLPVDCDLALSSFRWATSLGGWVDPPGKYVLRVHPEQAPWAERVLREEFGSDWRAHLMVDPGLTDVDEWYLECAHSIIYSAGA